MPPKGRQAGTAAHLVTWFPIYPASEWKYQLTASNLTERLVSRPPPETYRCLSAGATLATAMSSGGEWKEWWNEMHPFFLLCCFFIFSSIRASEEGFSHKEEKDVTAVWRRGFGQSLVPPVISTAMCAYNTQTSERISVYPHTKNSVLSCFFFFVFFHFSAQCWPSLHHFFCWVMNNLAKFNTKWREKNLHVCTWAKTNTSMEL